MSHANTTIYNDAGLDLLIAAIVHRSFVDRVSVSQTLAHDADVFLCDAFGWDSDMALVESQEECKRLNTLGILPDPMIKIGALPESFGEIVLAECRIGYTMSMDL